MENCTDKLQELNEKIDDLEKLVKVLVRRLARSKFAIGTPAHIIEGEIDNIYDAAGISRKE